MASYEQEVSALRKRQMLAQALQQQSVQGAQPQQVGGILVRPKGIGAVLNGLAGIAGGYLTGKAMKDETALTEQRRQQVGDALRAIMGGGAGSAAVPGQPNAVPTPPTGSAETPGIPGVRPGLPGSPSGAAVTPQTLATALRAGVVQPQAQGNQAPMGATGGSGAAPSNLVHALAPDPKAAAALAAIQSMPLQQQESILAQQSAAQLFPDPKDSPYAKIDPKDYTQESVAKYQASKNPADLVYRGEKPAATPSDIQEYEYAKQQGFKGSLLDYQLAQKKAGATQIVMPEQRYPNKFMEGLGEADVKQLTGYRDKAEASAQLVNTLGELEKLNPNAMEGGGAETRAQVANWLAGMTGVEIADPKVLNDTQQYNAIIKKAVLDSLGGSLGAGTSNADVSFISETVPKLEYSREARQQLIDYMRRRASESVDLYNRARDYGEKNQGLRGFTAYPIEGGPAPVGGLQRGTDGTLKYVRRPK